MRALLSGVLNVLMTSELRSGQRIGFSTLFFTIYYTNVSANLGESTGTIRISMIRNRAMKSGKGGLHKLLLACGMMMSPLLGFAFSEPKVVVETTAGSAYEFYIADNPRISYQDNLLVIQNDKGLTVSVEAAEVKSFRFYSSDVTAIKGIEMNGQFGSKLTGLKAGSDVKVYAIDGKSIQSTTVGNEGNAEIDFSQLPTGIYVIKTEKGSFKIKK